MTASAIERVPHDDDAAEQEPLITVTVNGCLISILGTAHVSQKSVNKVTELLHSSHFDAVAVELCPGRQNALINPDQLAKMNLFDVLRRGNGPMVIANLALSAYQQRLAQSLGVEPGGEIKVAVELARNSHLPVILIDRDIGTTLKRVYRSLSFWRRINLFGSLIASALAREQLTTADIERLKQGDMLETAFTEFANAEQDLFRPLIDERDQYMAARLRQATQPKQYKSILAVVGAGHLRGLHSYLLRQDSAPEQTIVELSEVPPPSQWTKFIPWVIVGVILFGFFLGFSQSATLGFTLIAQWVVINGGLAALGALLARAHPITVLSSFIAAPMTSLNPAISVGMVAAAVELYFVKPEVGDFLKLRDDTRTWRGWWRNLVSRTLLIFLFSNLGATVGTLIGAFQIFDNLR